MSDRKEKVANRLRELSAEFLGKETNRTSLITVTGASVSSDLKQATIYVTVLPADKEQAALSFLKRQRGGLREYFKKNMEVKTVPFVDIVIDQGEKNRQKIDELLRNG